MSKILDLLNKLIQHQKSAEAIGSLAEAQAFAAKIQSLMDEHKVGMSDVEFHAREVEEPFDFSAFVQPEAYSGGVGKRQQWTSTLCKGIANANECDLVRGTGNQYRFIGRTTNRQYCVIVSQYFFDLADAMLDLTVAQNKLGLRAEFEAWYAIHGYKDEGAGFRHWIKNYRKSWLNGFADALYTRFQALRKERDKAANGSGAIIHINKDALARKEYYDVVTKGYTRTKSKTNRAAHVGAYYEGKARGQAVNLNPHNIGQARRPQRTNLLGA